MMLKVFLVGMLCLMLSAPSSASWENHFMNCDGNWPSIFNVLRRCCNDERLPNGCECYDISSALTDFGNTYFHLPQCPGDIGATFTLFTRASATYGQIITPTEAGIGGTAYSGTKMTYFIIHGFTDSLASGWQVKMKDSLLAAVDANVILVDWKEGAKAPNYFQATANTRTVGAMIAWFIFNMNKFAGASYDNFHLIGHSLGAHVMGYAGKEIFRLTMDKKGNGLLLGRITGLDPAGLCFQDYSNFVHLSATDAQFVDIIHTDAEPLSSSGFGIQISIGNLDFYPNGGQHQPGCPAEILGILSMINFDDEKEDGACSHGRAIDIFTNSISNCRWETKSGRNTCAMGFHATADCKGDLSPTTTSVAPFC